MAKILSHDVFLVGLGNLERFYRRNLKPFDRDAYYEAVKSATQHKWEKCIRYATLHAKTFPKPVELREWMGLAEELTPAEEEHGNFKAGTIRGVSPQDLVMKVRRGESLPFDEECWDNESQRLFYLDAVYQDPPPLELNVDGRLAWIRKYAEAAEEMAAKGKAHEKE